MLETETGRSRRVEFELLRILAMAGVVMNHVINYGLDIYGDFRVATSSPAGAIAWSRLETNDSSYCKSHLILPFGSVLECP